MSGVPEPAGGNGTDRESTTEDDSEGIGSSDEWTVKEENTLWKVADEVYDDPGKWTLIADVGGQRRRKRRR